MLKHKENNKKSPLKDKPLRNPGQSLDQEIDRLINEDLIPYLFFPWFMILISLFEWWRLYKESPPHPWLFTITALIAVVYGIYKIVSIRRRVSALRLARDGEKEVAECLEPLREKGYRVFHDIIGNNFNLDHVIVSEHGIFVVETKTLSKPIKGNAKVVYDGSKITVDGFALNRNPVEQVSAGASWLRSVLKESTGKDFLVRSAVVFPSWFVENKVNVNSTNTWILNPKGLPAFIEKQPKSISKEDMKLASFHLSRFIRITA